jgi:hypothetical protein
VKKHFNNIKRLTVHGWAFCSASKNTMNGTLLGRKYQPGKIKPLHFFVAKMGSSIYAIFDLEKPVPQII